MSTYTVTLASISHGSAPTTGPAVGRKKYTGVITSAGLPNTPGTNRFDVVPVVRLVRSSVARQGRAPSWMLAALYQPAGASLAGLVVVNAIRYEKAPAGTILLGA